MRSPGKVKLGLCYFDGTRKRIHGAAQKVRGVSQVFGIRCHLPNGNKCTRCEITGRESASQFFGGRSGTLPLTRTSVGMSEIIKGLRSHFPCGRRYGIQRGDCLRKLAHIVSSNTPVKLILRSSCGGKLYKCVCIGRQGVCKFPGREESFCAGCCLRDTRR